MFALERRERLFKFIERHKLCSIKELMAQVGCSRATLQRDLAFLKEQGKIDRTHGGVSAVVPAKGGTTDFRYQNRLSSQVNEKKGIGRKAQDFIADKEIIFISSGTTTNFVAHYLPIDLELTVITNGLDIIETLADKPHVEVLLLGGMINYSQKQIGGPINLDILKELHIQKMIIGAGGITEANGVSFYDFSSVEYFRKIVTVVAETVVVADHTKIGRNALTHFAPLERIDHIVTDNTVRDSFINICREKNVNIHLATISKRFW